MKSSSDLHEAFILHSRNYRDNSLILDLLTREAGRYSVVARGARSGRSRVRGRLQPFTPLLIASVGRGELKTSTAIDFPGNPFRLEGDRLMLGLYVNELLYRLLGRFDPVTGLFDEYRLLLTSLQEHSSGIADVRMFELCLLQELGYGISFEYDARDGEPVEEEACYKYVVQEGFHRVSEAGDDAFYGGELLALASGRLEEVNGQKLKKLTRKSLGVLLGDKPLKSRSLFRGGAR